MIAGWRWWGIALGVSALAALGPGCDRRQPWVISNGDGIEPARPPQIIAEVYAGGECGPCEPAGERVYCASLTRENQGPAPDRLEGGAPYCFMATGLDETGEAFAIGCTEAEAGSAPVRITLAPILPGRFLVPSCDQTPQVFVDAGPRMDAGPPFDAGGFDAGPGSDAGAFADAGPPPLPPGTEVRVQFSYSGSGTANLFDHSSGSFIGGVPEAPGFGQLTTVVGDTVRVEATAASGWRIGEISGSRCAPMSPCVIEIARSGAVRVVFVPL